MPIDFIRWVLDVDLPPGPYRRLDAVSATRLSRTPGPVGVREAQALGRTLVTCDREFGGPWASGVEHPGIVILETPPEDASGMERNLAHLEFLIGKVSPTEGLRGSRFFVRTDCEVRRILADGHEIEAECWKTVHLQTSVASVTPQMQTLRGALAY